MENSIFNSQIIEKGDNYIKFGNNICFIFGKIIFPTLTTQGGGIFPYGGSKKLDLPFELTNLLCVQTTVQENSAYTSSAYTQGNANEIYINIASDATTVNKYVSYLIIGTY